MTVRASRLDDWDAELQRILIILNAGLAVLPDGAGWTAENFAQFARNPKPSWIWI